VTQARSSRNSPGRTVGCSSHSSDPPVKACPGQVVPSPALSTLPWLPLCLRDVNAALRRPLAWPEMKIAGDAHARVLCHVVRDCLFRLETLPHPGFDLKKDSHRAWANSMMCGPELCPHDRCKPQSCDPTRRFLFRLLLLLHTHILLTHTTHMAATVTLVSHHRHLRNNRLSPARVPCTSRPCTRIWAAIIRGGITKTPVEPPTRPRTLAVHDLHDLSASQFFGSEKPNTSSILKPESNS